MTWGWQQPYDAALREKDPGRLPERLVIAEKAIVMRLQELPGPADDLPEGRALREALNRLYALSPQEHHPPGQIQDEETDPTCRNWMRLAVPVGLGLALASATAWMAVRRNDLNDDRRMAAAAEMQARRNSRTTIIPHAGDYPVIDAGSHEHGLRGAPAPSKRDPRVIAKNRMDQLGTGAQSKNPNASPEAPAPRRGFSIATSTTKAPDTIAKAPGNVANAPGAQVESARARDSVDKSLVSTRANPEAQAAEDSQSTSSPATEPQEKSERPRGTVSVNASTYPSIRVPPELRSGATSSAESLQIGESVFRIDPTYPEEAERQHIDGTIKLRAFVGIDGTVENVEVMSGPPLLASAAVSAVRHWRYKPTLLGDHPIEVAQDITIVFRRVDASDEAH
jgi:TonB family protein